VGTSLFGGLAASEKEHRLTNCSWRLWGIALTKERAACARLTQRAAAGYGTEIPEDSDVEDDRNESSTSLKNAASSGEDEPEIKEEAPSELPLWRQPTITWAPPRITPNLYVVMVSIHGLVRGEEMELGKDADTGGQVKYVVDMARELGRHPHVARVDLFTRLVGPNIDGVDESYSVPLEPLDGPDGRSFVRRLQCGDSSVYYPKEQLWPHLREYSDRCVPVIQQTLAALNAQSDDRIRLACVHGHYADAGEIAANVACTLGVPMVLTGHSLGRNKLEHLLRGGRISPAEVEKKYNISRRIEGEERALNVADIVITSTAQEIAEQWALYDGYAPRLASVLRKTAASTRYGRSMALMMVIPPGVGGLELEADGGQADGAAATENGAGGGDASEGNGGTGNEEGSVRKDGMMMRRDGSVSSSMADLMQAAPEPAVWDAINRFLRSPGKPVILAMCRPDAKKNVASLVKAYGSTPGLKDLANLVLVLGTRGSVEELSVGAQSVVDDIFRLIDRYDIYGSVACPKHHTQADVPDIYRLAYATGGVFVNVALQEPFGLTLIEAASHGVPIVATCHGGPVDIHRTLRNGTLVEPRDVKAIGAALLGLVTDRDKWNECSRSGLASIHKYSWKSHCEKYIDAVVRCRGGEGSAASFVAGPLTPTRHVSREADELMRTGSARFEFEANIGDEVERPGSAAAATTTASAAAASAEYSMSGTHSDGEVTMNLAGDASEDVGIGMSIPSLSSRLRDDGGGYASDSALLPDPSPKDAANLMAHQPWHKVDDHADAAIDWMGSSYDRANSLANETGGSPTASLRSGMDELPSPAPLLVVAVDSCAVEIGARALANALREMDEGEGHDRKFEVGAASEVPIEVLAAALEAEGEKLSRLVFATAAAGTELYVPSAEMDGEMERFAPWVEHVSFRWRGEGFRRGMRHAGRGWLELDEDSSTELLLAYRTVSEADASVEGAGVVDRLAVLRRRLRTRGLHCSIVLSRAQLGSAEYLLQLLPSRAGRASALRFFCAATRRDLAKDVVIVAPSADVIISNGGASNSIGRFFSWLTGLGESGSAPRVMSGARTKGASGESRLASQLATQSDYEALVLEGAQRSVVVSSGSEKSSESSFPTGGVTLVDDVLEAVNRGTSLLFQVEPSFE